MKGKAAEYASAGIVPSQAQAEVLVAYLMQEARVSPKPDREVIEFYARELIALANESIDEGEPV